MFKIVEALESDIPAIIEVAEKTWWPTYSPILTADQIRYMLDAIYSPELLRTQLTGRHQTYLLLSESGSTEGFASFGKRPDDPDTIKIHKLYVLPRNQKKGYGQALVDEIKSRARAEQISTLDLNVNRFNSARHFYERLGFRVVREEDVPVGPYWMNDFVMRLEL